MAADWTTAQGVSSNGLSGWGAPRPQASSGALARQVQLLTCGFNWLRLVGLLLQTAAQQDCSGGGYSTGYLLLTSWGCWAFPSQF